MHGAVLAAGRGNRRRRSGAARVSGTRAGAFRAGAFPLAVVGNGRDMGSVAVSGVVAPLRVQRRPLWTSLCRRFARLRARAHNAGGGMASGKAREAGAADCSGKRGAKQRFRPTDRDYIYPPAPCEAHSGDTAVCTGYTPDYCRTQRGNHAGRGDAFAFRRATGRGSRGVYRCGACGDFCLAGSNIVSRVCPGT
ncbi:hypothetical protein HRbin16_02936 [bacterium HR16]|nr:hypothetical protein HRbin16_02936 [bacterium HR16]